MSKEESEELEVGPPMHFIRRRFKLPTKEVIRYYGTTMGTCEYSDIIWDPDGSERKENSGKD